MFARTDRPKLSSPPASRHWGAAAALGALLVLFGSRAHAQSIDTTLWVTNGAVATAARSGNTLYIGGIFDQVGPYTGGGVPIDATSGALQAGFPKINGDVYAVASDGAGGWYIGGSFGAVEGVPRSNLAQVNSSMAVTSWNPGSNNVVRTITVSGSIVYVGGDFTLMGGQPRSSIAALDAVTGAPTAWNPNANGGGQGVYAIAVSGSTVYAGGTFANIGGQARSGIAALDATSGLASAWNPSPSPANVSALAVSGTNVYAGGAFTFIGGSSRHYIAALDVSSGLATAWDPNADFFVTPWP